MVNLRAQVIEKESMKTKGSEAEFNIFKATFN